MIEVSRKAGMRVIIFLVTITLGVFAMAQADAQSDSSVSLHRSTTMLVSPATASAGTYFDHVIIILMENQGVFDICRSSPPPCSTSGPAPYMAGLANNYTIGAQYLSLIETSQPNYVALISGSTQGCTSTGCPIIKAPNLVDRFEATGVTWKGYMENQTLTAGCDLKDHEPYVTIHNPFLPFQDITNNTARCNKIVLANP
ncbi:MAG TPA: alkaline phosphatase family protein, partial [Ktedonobacteraceae bacterium]|nr:alkaline phosphatase family protein [Ktedonobacteraceae bacterium]